MDLATLMQQAAALTGTQQQAANQVSGLYSQASQSAAEVGQVKQQAAQDTYSAELTRLEGELKAQNSNIKLAQAYGTDASAQGNAIIPLADLMKQTAVKLTQAQQQVQEVEANSDLIGNPLGWLKDLVMGDELRANRDALAKSFDQQSKTAQALNAATQTSIQTQNAIKESLTATSIQQIASVKAADAKAEAAQWQIESAKLGASSIEVLSKVGAEAFSRNAQLFNMQQAAEQMAMAREERAMRLKDKKDQEAELQDITDNINAFNKVYGRPEVAVSMVKRGYATGGEFGEYLRHADVAGSRIRTSGSLEGSLGTTPSQTYSAVQSGSVEAPRTWKPSLDVFKQAEVQFQQELDTRDKATGKTKRESMKKEELPAFFDSLVKKVAEQAASSIQHGTGNPFEVPNIETVLSSPTKEGQALAASPFRTEVLDSLVATGISNPSPEQIMQTSAAAVAAGKLRMEDAIKWGSQYYKEGKALKEATGGFSTMAVPVAAGYKVPADFITKEPAGARTAAGTFLASGSGSFGFGSANFLDEQRQLRTAGVKTIDLTNSADFTTAMTIIMSRRRAEEIKAAGGGAKTFSESKLGKMFQ